ncbi:hypothetical protein B0O99DRAFT_694504 [Bisporella sp. PMI_857]|nr:hypothetical protein B0O99DRAFT_694504 [Bisporella sp. PMI_857]
MDGIEAQPGTKSLGYEHTTALRIESGALVMDVVGSTALRTDVGVKGESPRQRVPVVLHRQANKISLANDVTHNEGRKLWLRISDSRATYMPDMRRTTPLTETILASNTNIREVLAYSKTSDRRRCLTYLGTQIMAIMAWWDGCQPTIRFHQA